MLIAHHMVEALDMSSLTLVDRLGLRDLITDDYKMDNAHPDFNKLDAQQTSAIAAFVTIHNIHDGIHDIMAADNPSIKDLTDPEIRKLCELHVPNFMKTSDLSDEEKEELN